MAAPPPPLVALPEHPHDPHVLLPAAPDFPPTVDDSIVAQAAAADPGQAVAPPWANQLRINLQNDIRAIILPDVKRLVNQRRGDGTVAPFDVVPFADGSDPTLPPNNLPRLCSVNDIDNLNGQDLRDYLIGYGVVPLPVGANGIATNRLRKATLKGLVGAAI